MADSEILPPDEAGKQVVDLRQALEQRYLSYALSTITQRALPDARDGLKPVHRRILYGMRLLRLDPDGSYKKSAKVVGDVMGSFHPHGDQSIYDALVRLAQDFSMRYPMVDGQGNFGNIDGDGAAAMRYTETRMTDVAMRQMEGMAENAVDFKPNYDGADEEPVDGGQVVQQVLVADQDAFGIPGGSGGVLQERGVPSADGWPSPALRLARVGPVDGHPGDLRDGRGEVGEPAGDRGDDRGGRQGGGRPGVGDDPEQPGEGALEQCRLGRRNGEVAAIAGALEGLGRLADKRPGDHPPDLERQGQPKRPVT